MLNKEWKVLGKKLLIVILFAFILVMVLNLMMGIVVHRKKEVMVPDLRHKTLVQAIGILSNYELYVKKIAEQPSMEFPNGTIIDQQPKPGMVVKEGKVIKIITSSGGKAIFVPDIVGKALREATLILRQEGLLLGEENKEYSTMIKKDFIISQYPSPDTIVEKGTMVNLIVSLGQGEETPVIEMPVLVGKNIRDMKKLFSGSNIKIGKMRMISDNTVPEGTIIKQNPEAGEIIGVDGTDVDLVIAKRSEDSKVVNELNIYYEVSQGPVDKNVRIVVVDEQGERTVHNEKHAPGSKISVPVQAFGRAKVKISVNDILMEERRYD